ncbi:hypothetical protein SCH01S_32_00160 [Sphingomonas changbaiensis NBRC 104936]|uniref:Rv0623-like transcription factor n=1 Tax=Sphingomonas changbaiensis NBRC 104936 TaxID=1219043 RepID=A0A0E9MPK6_9SPHN|nr:type II toxin-antitoxin system VapB family antitoxin [Sphingomonas changbaiensis]GAO39479.1 hypothetical protein SCH01S_32_00160 [Sphingomonas changbaiensis NBRC 104936]
MGAELKIDSAEAIALAEQLARSTGESVERVVLDALRKRAREVDLQLADPTTEREKLELEFYRMIAGSRSRWKGAMLSIDHADILYDEDGLPR